MVKKQNIFCIKLMNHLDLPQDPRSADAATEQTGGSAGSGLKTAGVLDFSSASEDEDPCCSRRSETHTGEQTGAGTSCIGNMGLYSVLQRQITQRGLQETDSEEDFSSQSQNEDNCAKPTTIKGQASKTLDLSIESDEGIEGVTDGKPQRISEVSADLELLPPRSHKHNKDSTTGDKNHVHKRVKFADKRSEVDIESFSSSEDEVRCMKGPSPQENKSTQRWSSGKDNTTQMSLGIKSQNTIGSNKTQSRDEGNTGTLDSLLGTWTWTIYLDLKYLLYSVSLLMVTLYFKMK